MKPHFHPRPIPSYILYFVINSNPGTISQRYNTAVVGPCPGKRARAAAKGALDGVMVGPPTWQENSLGAVLEPLERVMRGLQQRRSWNIQESQRTMVFSPACRWTLEGPHSPCPVSLQPVNEDDDPLAPGTRQSIRRKFVSKSNQSKVYKITGGADQALASLETLEEQRQWKCCCPCSWRSSSEISISTKSLHGLWL